MSSLSCEKESLKKTIEYELEEHYRGTNIELLFRRLSDIDCQIEEKKITKTDYYVGEMKKDRYHGFGHFVDDNGSGYFGYWKNGEKDGYGIEYDTKDAFYHFYHFHKMIVGLNELYEAELVKYHHYGKNNGILSGMYRQLAMIDDYCKNNYVLTDKMKKECSRDYRYINYVGNYIKEHDIKHLFEVTDTLHRKKIIRFNLCGGSERERLKIAKAIYEKETLKYAHVSNCAYKKRQYGEDIVLLEGFGRRFDSGIHKEVIEFMDKGKDILG